MQKKDFQIFFSYGHDKNADIVNRLANDLIGEGYQIWIDHSKIKEGDDWRRVISESVCGSKALVSFASKYSVRDPGVCLDELSIAVAIRGAQIQSILLEKNVDPPVTVSYRQYLDMSDWNQYWGMPEFETWYAEKKNKVISAIDSEETQKYMQEILFVREELNPELISGRKESLSRQIYCGRDWLKQLLNEALTAGKRNILLLGSPGCGKSSFMAHEFVHNQDVGAVVFCEWDNPMLNNIDAIGRSIAFQLAARLPDFRLRLLNILQREKTSKESGISSGSSRNVDVKEDNSFERYVIEPLKYLIDGDRPDTFILIDGLDELEAVSGRMGRRKNELSEILEKYADQFPRWLRFIISSRNDAAAVRPLTDFHVISIDANSEGNHRDISTYVAYMLQSKVKEDEQLTQLIDLCAGNFLYATMVCDMIVKQEYDIQDALKNLRSLGRIYLKNFDRILQEIDWEEKGYYEAICALCVSKEPLPVSTLRRQLSWKQREAKEFKTVFQTYLSGGEELSFFHKSVIDWLFSDEAEEYQVDSEEGTKIIANACLKAWQSSVHDMNEYELKYIRSSLQEAKSPFLKEVMADYQLGHALLEKANEKIESNCYADAEIFASEASRIFRKILTHDALRDALSSWKIMISCSTKSGNFELCKTACQDATKYLDDILRNLERNRTDTEGWLNGEEDIVDFKHRLVIEKASFFYTLGVQASSHNQWEEAHRNFDDAERCYLICNDTENVLQVQLQKALCYRVWGNLHKATAMIEEVVRSTDMEKLLNANPELYISIQMNLGYCYFSNGRYPIARPLLEKCLDVVHRTGDRIAPRYIAQTNFLMSVIEFAEGHYRDCVDYAGTAAEQYAQIYGEQAVDITSSLHEKGLALLELGEWKAGEECFKRTYKIRSDYYGENNMYTSFAMLNLAKAGIASGIKEKIEEAVELLNKVRDMRLSILDGDKNNVNIAMVCIEQGHAWELLGDMDKARDYAKEAWDIYDFLNNEIDKGKCRFLIGRTYLAEGDVDRAIKYLQSAKQQMMKIVTDGNHPYIHRIEKLLGEISQ